MKKPYTENELKVLNSNLAIQLMLQSQKLEPKKVLNTIKYEHKIEGLQEELIKMQQWVVANGKRVCILFEGRDAAGKGGAIRRINHHLNPRNYRVVALDKPTEQERGQWYFQRYVNKLPNPGEIVFFDRSWYNRAVVEPVMGFCTQKEYQQFMKDVVNFENMFTADGLILIKFYFSITKSEQQRRFEEIKINPLKRWKLSPVDDKAQELWDEYTQYKEAMFATSDTPNNPWIILKANKKTEARMAAMKHILRVVPYEKLEK